MKPVCLSVFLVLLLLPFSAFAQNSAQSAILIEQSTGRVLYEKNAEEPLPMASTTKIMTALVALENGDVNANIKISAKAASTEGSSMYLQEGETLTLLELLYGLMLSSGNDAAVAISEHFGGNDAFVAMMNQRAEALGAQNTHFENPNGLPHENHYSTAEDMARICAEALKNELFAQIVATKSYRIEGESKAYPRTLSNHNKLLSLYEGCIGVKTGYTKAAGRCLVSAATREGMTLICITLNDGNDWQDHRTLFDTGFQDYEMVTFLKAGEALGEASVTGSDTATLSYTAKEDLSYPVKKGEDISLSPPSLSPLSAPVQAGETCGTVNLQKGNSVLKTASLITCQDARRVLFPAAFREHFSQVVKAVYTHFISLVS